MTGRRLVPRAGSRWLGCDQDVVEPTAHTGRAPVQSLDQLIIDGRKHAEVLFDNNVAFFMEEFFLESATELYLGLNLSREDMLGLRPGAGRRSSITRSQLDALRGRVDAHADRNGLKMSRTPGNC